MAIITVSTPGVVNLILNAIHGPVLPFSVSGGSCIPPPNTLLPGDSCTIEITYRPTQVAEHNGQLVIYSDDPNSPTIIELNGNSFAQTIPVPTLSQWPLMLMLLGLMLSAGMVYRHKV